jgi:AraC-like DNA-binding protein
MASSTPRVLQDPWTAADPVADVLHDLRMNGVFYCRSEFTAPWGLEVPPFAGCMMFHVVTEGAGWLEVEGEPPRALVPGMLALVPRGGGHRLTSAPGGPVIDLIDAERELVSARYEVLRHGGGGAPTSMLCGLVRVDHPAAGDLLRSLPAVILAAVDQSPQHEWLHSTLRLVAAEARAFRAGSDAVITRLADLLVVHAIRSWIVAHPAAPTGWIAALRDRHIGQALSLIHRHPGRRWTVARLAEAVGMSRSAFAARFTALVGTPALRYVTDWRMRAAHAWLSSEGATVADLAARLGYSTEAAFSRAFKRARGLSPGAVRRHSWTNGHEVWTAGNCEGALGAE